MSENEKLKEQLQELFYWFHEHPELPYEEYATTEKIREFLTCHNIRILPWSLETGLAAVIEGEQTGPVQLLRCDIDALPIVEKTEVPYRSKTEGKMHACGHDMHIVAGLGCALLLQENRDKLKGTVKIIFQPAEESATGAVKVLETNVMKNVERAWGFHADPTNPVGTIGIREGYVTAAVDRLVIRIKGVGCHGAHPEDGIDSVLVAAAIVQALQSVTSRNRNPFHPALLSITRISAGTTWNVIPPEAVLEGTVRTLNKEDRLLYEERVKEIACRTAQAYGAEAAVEWISGPPATWNDKEMADLCEKCAKEAGMQVVLEESSLGGDDFAFYEENIPGCYVKIGTGVGPTIHHPEFKVEPSVLLPAAVYLTDILLKQGMQSIP